jgi:hypothetical protein
MSEHAKIKPSHRSRIAIVYVRQSSAAQVEHNRESTARQYALTQRAAALGWSDDRVTVIVRDGGRTTRLRPRGRTSNRASVWWWTWTWRSSWIGLHNAPWFMTPRRIGWVGRPTP